ncbi:MAG: hypothetical protein IJS67_01690, partial [Clostridia bacterium]|nr:hypothetical protein [Clostridia bacterium]
MKKFNYTFLIFAIVTAILFVLTGAFALGEVSSPSSYWLTTVKSDGNDVEDAAATITLDRKFTSLNEEGNETSVMENV